MENETKERDRESYLQWQKLAIEQLGYVINFLFTLAGAVLAFAAKIMMDGKTPSQAFAHCMFQASLLVVSLSIVCALAANITRANDFRNTRRAAHARWKGEDNHSTHQDRARIWGKWTWGFFYCQTATFGLGALLFCFSIWIGYGG